MTEKNEMKIEYESVKLLDKIVFNQITHLSHIQQDLSQRDAVLEVVENDAFYEFLHKIWGNLPEVCTLKFDCSDLK